MKVLLAGHGGAYNRGCEAIVESTCLLFSQRYPDCSFVLASLSPEADRKVNWSFPLEIIPGRGPGCHTGRGTPWYERRRYTWYRPSARWRVPLAPLVEAAPSCDVILSIGGDNYTTDYGYPDYFLNIIALAKGLRKPVVIWGASVGPFPNEARWEPVWERLRAVDLITARESLTLEYLKEHGLGDRVKLVADPAFVLPPRPVDLTPFWPGGEVVGLCMSPLMLRLAEREGNRLDVAVVRFVRWLVDELGLTVLLIPHVMGGHNQDEEDYACAQALYALVERPGGVAVAPESLSAAEYKHIISQCRYMISARTHAVVAGYSTGVPTLALSYSQKARGMCLDLFGHTDYLVEGHTAGVGELQGAFERLARDRETVGARLAEINEDLVTRTRAGVEHVGELVGQ